MGGGEGSKERRRLKRLQKLGHDDTEAKTPRKERFPSFSKSKIISSTKEKFNPKNALGRQKKANMSNWNNQKKKIESSRAKPKVKKPKHLKRKLEQSQDEETRETVLKEVHEFRAKKAELSQNPKKKAKSGTEDLFSNKNILDFPRATRPVVNAEKKKSPKPEIVIEEEREIPSEATIKTKKEILEVTGIKEDSDDEDCKKKLSSNSVTLSESLPDGDNDDDDDEDGGDDDDEMAVEQAPKRERGRRRRGRKDTAAQIEEVKAKTASENAAKNDDTTPTSKKENTGNQQKRYCIGRKPVTDFVIGQKYEGRVVYIKDFGVFFDIGSHSDAFCHVSRLRDDYVKNPHELFKEGDIVQARVVEIDRKQKKLTVSLQSDERAADEKASVEARAQRKKARKDKDTKKKQKSSGTNESPTISTNEFIHEPSHSPKQQIRNSSISASPALEKKDASEMTPAELKRSRKLARRAARREASAENE